MPTRRDFLLAAACSAAAAPAAAADASARAFVMAIYAAYEGKNGNGITLDNDQALQLYFEPSIAALIGQDQKDATRRDETAKLDFDPFVDAQDWDIAAFNVAVSDTGPGKASATVKFNNFDKQTTIVLDLIKIRNEWKISDITWQRDGERSTLRQMYAH